MADIFVREFCFCHWIQLLEMSGCAKFLASRPLQDHETIFRKSVMGGDLLLEQAEAESSSGEEPLVDVRKNP